MRKAPLRPLARSSARNAGSLALPLLLGLALPLTACSDGPADPGTMTPTEEIPLPMLDPPLEPGDPGASDVQLVVRSDKDVRAISPLVYGVNVTRDAATNRPAVIRSGGNRMTAYNWENNASNAGSDYQYQNDAFLTASSTPGDAVKPLLDAAKQGGAAALLTVPIVDHVAADKNGGGDVRNSGANYLQTRFKQNKPSKGGTIATTPDTQDASVYQDEFVTWARNAAPGVPLFFSLDNEPDLWSSTHPEVHKDAVRYDELVQRSTDYAKAIKRAVPEARVTGFVSYGWQGYVDLQTAPDHQGKGDFIEYYLTQMKAAESAAGQRLIDYLDLHWYPEVYAGSTRITDKDASAAVAEARVQAPRSLWDEGFRESSWIANSINQPVRLLPRLKDKIGSKYPGTQLAFSEWNYGGGGHVSGAIATADVLGIFGRDGVGLATFWELNADESYSYAALRAYRNFDGAGGQFGDVSIHASASDKEAASVYASIGAKDAARVVLVVINKRTQAKKAGITVAHPTALSRASVYTLTAAGARLTAAAPLTAVAQNAFSYTMPASSVSVLVLAP